MSGGSRRRWVLGGLGGALGVAAAGTAIGVLRERRQLDRAPGDQVAFGTLRSPALTVVADDGVPLHVEIDEVDRDGASGAAGATSAAARVAAVRERLAPRARPGRRRGAEAPPTIVFVHGYCLTLDSWHFQRAAYRGLLRTVFYDQRSHGRSGRSDREHATIDQLGRDLARVIETAAPEGPVVLVGHSMGGMSIIALAEQQPELFGDRVVGVALLSTTAGGLDPARILLPVLPVRLTGGVTRSTVAALNRGSGLVDLARRAGRQVLEAATHHFAFGGDVPVSYVQAVDDMLAATPFEVVADFFPAFHRLDKFDSLAALGAVPVVILCGTRDRLTALGHSRKLRTRIPGARLVECLDAGHMIPLERHEQVNAELDQLLARALGGAS
ncbi:alpha/beta fold hydrolase [Nocardioides sp.]|uniref:alpha/beta fold hydrolase n=1 Tax=Nocardioides sp. TaxID=35761 RepID=UPI00351393C5